MKLIVGLGNPGTKYQNTRHNIGFSVLDYFLEQQTANFADWQHHKKLQADLAEGKINGHKIILAKPTTLMNKSGQAVQAISHFYKIAPAEMLIIHDDADIFFGEYKIQANRGSAGHHGIESIINALGTQDLARLRIGIGRATKQAAENLVLKKFSLIERLKLRALKPELFVAIKNFINN